VTLRGHRIAALLVVACAAVGVGTSVDARPAVAASSQAVVIVDTGSVTYTRVISFSGTVSGYEALVLAGADPVTYGYAGQGAAICRLFGVGNDPGGNSCLGTPDDPKYWAYHRVPAGAEGWLYSRAGAGATRVGDGDVEGWRFGIGVAPGFRSFCSVATCEPPPAPAPAPAPDGGPVAETGGSGPGAGAAPGSGGPGGAAGAAGAAAGGSSGAAAGGSSGGATGVATTGAVPSDGGIGSGPAPSGAGRTAVRGDRSDDSDRSDDRAGVAAPPGAVGGSGGPGTADPGSPVGVIVAAVLTLAIAGLAWVWRRRAA
jgi:hypothetical protein